MHHSCLELSPQRPVQVASVQGTAGDLGSDLPNAWLGQQELE